MNQSETRQHAAELIIALCLCGGGWYFLVKPAQSSLAAARAEIAQLEAQKSAWAASDLPMDQAREMLGEAADRVRAVDQRSAPARDESVMFSTVMDLAARYDVRVDQLSPGGKRFAAENAPPPLDPAAPRPELPRDLTVSYNLAVTASYPALAAFVADLQNQIGYSVVKNVRILPGETLGEELVSATLTTEHFAFDTGAVWKTIAAVPGSAQTPAAPGAAPASPAPGSLAAPASPKGD